MYRDDADQTGAISSLTKLVTMLEKLTNHKYDSLLGFVLTLQYHGSLFYYQVRPASIELEQQKPSVVWSLRTVAKTDV